MDNLFETFDEPTNGLELPMMDFEYEANDISGQPIYSTIFSDSASAELPIRTLSSSDMLSDDACGEMIPNNFYGKMFPRENDTWIPDWDDIIGAHELEIPENNNLDHHCGYPDVYDDIPSVIDDNLHPENIKEAPVDSDPQQKTTRKIQCPECGKEYKHYSSLNKHKKAKHGQKPACVCGKEFAYQKNLKAHYRKCPHAISAGLVDL